MHIKTFCIFRGRSIMYKNKFYSWSFYDKLLIYNSLLRWSRWNIFSLLQTHWTIICLLRRVGRERGSTYYNNLNSPISVAVVWSNIRVMVKCFWKEPNIYFHWKNFPPAPQIKLIAFRFYHVLWSGSWRPHPLLVE